MERKLRYLEKEIKKDGTPMLDTGENPDAPQPREMIDLEVRRIPFLNKVKLISLNFHNNVGRLFPCLHLPSPSKWMNGLWIAEAGFNWPEMKTMSYFTPPGSWEIEGMLFADSDIKSYFC